MISRVYLAAVLTCAVASETAHNVSFSKHQEACEKFGADPYFDPKLIVGPPWRIYYSWNTMMEKGCFFDMTFMEINPEIVNRYRAEMAEYMEDQPAWGHAVLVVTLSRGSDASHQSLLLTGRGPAGRLHGVPDLTTDPYFVAKKSVPLLQFQMKLVRGGRYLAMMDCLLGMTTLSAHFSEGPPNRAEIESVAKELGIGAGFPACT